LRSLAAAATAGAALLAASATSAPREVLTGAEATALTREISGEVERLRGLQFKRPVPVKIVDDAQARAHFEERLKKFWPEAEARHQQAAHVRLGLLPADFDLVAGLLDTLEEQAGGFYDPDSDTFFILKDMPRGAAPLLIAHELTHALDDQHYGIDAMLRAAEDDDDRQTAVSAVVEGSGMLIMSRYLMGQMQAGRMKMEELVEFQKSEAGKARKLKASPPLLQRSLLGSYLLGQAFLLRGQPLGPGATGEPADIDRAFKAPPLSSEQVLHPDKYWVPGKADPPRAVTIPDLASVLGRGWSLGVAGTLGELTLALMTDTGSLDVTSAAALDAARWTTPAASGWGGDLYHHYVNGTRNVTVLSTVWDTEADAAEFEKALPRLAGRQTWRRGATVAIIAGDAADRHEAMAARLLDAATPKP
jgi:hypothetical protein